MSLINVSVFLDQEMSVSHFMERGCIHFLAPFIDKASDPSACTDINSLIFKTAATRIRYVCCITLLKSIVQTKKSNQGRQFTNQDICFYNWLTGLISYLNLMEFPSLRLWYWRYKANGYTTLRHRGYYSTTTKRTSTLFLFYYDNKIELIFFCIEDRNRSICDVIHIQNYKESWFSHSDD